MRRNISQRHDHIRSNDAPLSKEGRTCYPGNRQSVFGCEQVLQDARRYSELYGTAYRCDQERGTNVEVKRLRDRGIKRNEGKDNADVRPCKIRDCRRR